MTISFPNDDAGRENIFIYIREEKNTCGTR